MLPWCHGIGHHDVEVTGLGSNHGYKSLLQQAMDVSEADANAGVYLSMDPLDSMVLEQRHRLYFLHMAPAHTYKLYGSNLTHAECLDVLGEAADVARFCNTNVLLGLKLEDFVLPSDHVDVEKVRNQIQQKLAAPPPAARKAAGRTLGVNKKVLEMTAAMGEDEVAEGKVKRGLGWPKLHKKWWKRELEVDWVPSPSSHIPPQYQDNVFFAGLPARTRDIIVFLDQSNPLAEDALEQVVDLSDNIDRTKVWYGHCPTIYCNSLMWLRKEGRWLLNRELLAVHGFANFNAFDLSQNMVSQAIGDSFNLFSAGAICMGLVAAGVI